MNKRRNGVWLAISLAATLGCLGLTIFLCGPLTIDILRHSILENPTFLRPTVRDLGITSTKNLDGELILREQLSINQIEEDLNIYVFEDQDILLRSVGDVFTFVDLDSFTVSQPGQQLRAYSLDPEIAFGTVATNPVFWDVLVHTGYIYAYPDTHAEEYYLVVLAPPDQNGLRLISKFPIKKYVDAFVISGDRLYLGDTDNGFYIFDISDPTDLQLIAYHEEIEGIDYSFSHLYVVGDYIYAISRTLYVLDVSDPQRPFVVNSLKSYYNSFPSLSSFKVSGDKGFWEERYELDRTPYLSVLDLSDPSKPSYIVTYDFCQRCRVWTVIDEIVYMVDFGDYSLKLFDFSDAVSSHYLGIKQLQAGNWAIASTKQDQLLMSFEADLGDIEASRLYLYEYVP